MDDIASGVMTRRKLAGIPRSATVKPSGEHRLRGCDIALPLVDAVSAIHSHSALRIPWHSHRRFELIFVLEGATAYEFSDGRTVELAGGWFVVMPPRAVHRGVHDVRMPAKLCGVLLDLDAPGAWRNTPFTARDLDWMRGQFETHALAARPMSAELRRSVLALNRHVSVTGARADRSGAAAVRLLTCGVILEAARHLTASRPAKAKRTVENALAHMQTHAHEPLRMSNLARAAGCSRARLFQLFKQTTGMAPNDYLQRLRVNNAREMLADPARAITDIAFAAGFSSSQYFSNVFRKYTGVTPTQFRHEHDAGRPDVRCQASAEKRQRINARPSER